MAYPYLVSHESLPPLEPALAERIFAASYVQAAGDYINARRPYMTAGTRVWVAQAGSSPTLTWVAFDAGRPGTDPLRSDHQPIRRPYIAPSRPLSVPIAKQLLRDVLRLASRFQDAVDDRDYLMERLRDRGVDVEALVGRGTADTTIGLRALAEIIADEADAAMAAVRAAEPGWMLVDDRL